MNTVKELEKIAIYSAEAFEWLHSGDSDGDKVVAAISSLQASLLLATANLCARLERIAEAGSAPISEQGLRVCHRGHAWYVEDNAFRRACGWRGWVLAGSWAHQRTPIAAGQSLITCGNCRRTNVFKQFAESNP